MNNFLSLMLIGKTFRNLIRFKFKTQTIKEKNPETSFLRNVFFPGVHISTFSNHILLQFLDAFSPKIDVFTSVMTRQIAKDIVQKQNIFSKLYCYTFSIISALTFSPNFSLSLEYGGFSKQCH